MAASASVASCADEPIPVVIGIDASSEEQVVLGEIYSQIFDAMGYAAGVSSFGGAEALDPLEILRAEPVDLVVTCTGAVLETYDSAAAAELAASGMEGEELSVATYDAAVGTLPATMRTVDPSPAQGCGYTDGERLVQNIIPVFRNGKFDRGTIQRINFITRMMATEDIAESAEKVGQGVPADVAVADWLLEYAGIAPGPAGGAVVSIDPEQPPV
ncbi:hypothetical protein V6D40_04100 [Corynebacterium sp. Q4381]|uniref:hypothetical protein n=1 Tax=Corynebacterium sp. Marseille-Q4381 TaxID=3121597 RepID=UPI002FE59A41